MILPKDKMYAIKLRQLRIRRNIKQSVASEMLELRSQQNYSKLENGQKHFTDIIIKNICKVFNIDEALFTNLEDRSCTDKNYELPSKNEIESLKNFLSLKSEVCNFQKTAYLTLNKMLLEKEIELLNLKIKNFMVTKHVYNKGTNYLVVEYS